jgi:DNA-binding MarR family transcriptional regulator
LRAQLSTGVCVPGNKKAAVPALRLSEFVPFRLNRLAAAVSEHLSAIYRDRFGLQIPEWRVLVTIGRSADCTAQQIAASTCMHKTRVSRAVAALRQRGLLERASSSRDGRAMHLRLTGAGGRLYTALVPLALARERRLLSCMSGAQRRELLDGLTLLEEALGLKHE